MEYCRLFSKPNVFVPLKKVISLIEDHSSVTLKLRRMFFFPWGQQASSVLDVFLYCSPHFLPYQLLVFP